MRLARASEGGLGSSPEFLRTHPVPERRIKVSKGISSCRTCQRALSCSILKNSSPKHTRYAPPVLDVLVFVIPLVNFLEA